MRSWGCKRNARPPSSKMLTRNQHWLVIRHPSSSSFLLWQNLFFFLRINCQIMDKFLRNSFLCAKSFYFYHQIEKQKIEILVCRNRGGTPTAAQRRETPSPSRNQRRNSRPYNMPTLVISRALGFLFFNIYFLFTTLLFFFSKIFYICRNLHLFNY